MSQFNHFVHSTALNSLVVAKTPYGYTLQNGWGAEPKDSYVIGEDVAKSILSLQEYMRLTAPDYSGETPKEKSDDK